MKSVCIPDWDGFQKAAEQNEIIPVYREISGDIETPVSLYLKVCAEHTFSFLLESAEKAGTVGRYSFIGFGPWSLFKSKGRQVEIIENGMTHRKRSNPVYQLRKFVRKYKSRSHEGLPRFISGAVGYLSYDMVRFFEKIPDGNREDLNFPESYFMFVDTVLAVDHLQHSIRIIANVNVKNRDMHVAYLEAVERINRIHNLIKMRHTGGGLEHRTASVKRKEIFSNLTKKEFEEIVKAAKDYIHAGDIFQTVLSQRFQVEVKSDPFSIYRTLRTINPSPYMFFLHFDELYIIGSSPEVLVKAEDGIMMTRPLAGTIRRGRTVEEDKQFARKLLRDTKERAEHTMLVDLARNDLGRICEYGSVRVLEKMNIEQYSHVMHIVSHIEGKIRDEVDQLDIIQASFPAGTVSGAPKIRAMEIIDELEQTRRGIYAGAVGYFDLFGNLDFCISIRTMIYFQGHTYIQAGAGIVFDSIPEREYFETLNKARALVRAIEVVEGRKYDFGNR